MKPGKIIIFALAALLAAGCGTSKKASKTQRETTQSGDKPKKILYPKGSDHYADQAISPEDKKASRPKITFSETESAHVRIAGINPLPEGGILAVNLDRLGNEFCYPYNGRFLSDYGIRGQAMHTGIDIKTIPDDTVRAVLPGIVRMSKFYSSYGNIVVIRHYCGFETVYAHCSRNLVNVNDKVEAGDPVGLGGRTGRATTEHVHFEVRAAGEHIDPKRLLNIENRSLQKGMLFFQKLDGGLVAYSSQGELNSIKDSRWDVVADNRIPKTPVAPPGGVTPVPDQVPLPESVQETIKEKEEVTVRKAPTSGSGQQPGSAASKTYHTVQKGDTLYSISRKYSTTVKKLCELNGIKENSILSINQKIQVK